jgi:hypothetical protein
MQTMAEAKQAPAQKKIEVTVVSNYGQHRPGETLSVDEREYNRLRAPIIDEETGRRTGFTFPVLISRADQAKLDEHRRAEEDTRKRAQAEKDESEAGPGWAELERQSIDRIMSNFKAEQDAQTVRLTTAIHKELEAQK